MLWTADRLLDVVTALVVARVRRQLQLVLLLLLDRTVGCDLERTSLESCNAMPLLGRT